MYIIFFLFVIIEVALKLEVSMKKISIDTLHKFKFLSNLKLSPNETYAAFSMSISDPENNEYVSSLNIVDSSNNSIKKITADDFSGVYDFIDDNTIVFSSKREKPAKNSKDKDDTEKTYFYKISFDGGEAELLMEIDKIITQLDYLFDSKYLIQYKNSPKKEEGIDADDYLVFDEFPYRFNGRGYINKTRNRLALYDAESKSVLNITDEITNVGSICISADKSKVLYTASSYEIKTDLSSCLYEYDIESGESKLLLKDISGLSDAGYIGEDIYYMAPDREKYGLNTNPHLYILKDGKSRVLMEDLDSNLGNSLGTDLRLGGDDSPRIFEDYIYFLSTEVDKVLLYRVNVDSTRECVVDIDGSIDEFVVGRNGIYFTGMKPNRVQELYHYNGDVTEVSDFNSFISDYEVSEVETFDFINDGISFKAYVIPPSLKNENNKYPAILTIHGGPKTVYGTVLHHEMQLLSSLGYYVFYMNPRGSDGRGNEFMDIRGVYGSIDYDDLMALTDEVLDRYEEIDQTRLGVMGGSYGGFMTNWIIGHTDRFKRACTQRCISNWTSMYGTSDIGFYFVEDQISGTPWRDFEKLWDMSPLKYADKAVTPTLIIHADEDHRCPPEQGHQMYLALMHHDVETKMVVFKGENHDLSRSGKPLHRNRRLTEIVEWMSKL